MYARALLMRAPSENKQAKKTPLTSPYGISSSFLLDPSPALGIWSLVRLPPLYYTLRSHTSELWLTMASRVSRIKRERPLALIRYARRCAKTASNGCGCPRVWQPGLNCVDISRGAAQQMRCVSLTLPGEEALQRDNPLASRLTEELFPLGGALSFHLSFALTRTASLPTCILRASSLRSAYVIQRSLYVIYLPL